MEGILRLTSTLGTAAVVAGVVSEFFIYDGNQFLCVHLINQNLILLLFQLMPELEPLFSINSEVSKKRLFLKELTSRSHSFK